MNKKIIPIFFSIDNQYAPYLGVAIQSIIENASKDYNYKIIILYQNLSKENMDKISVSVKDNFEINYVYIEDGLETITDRIENKLRCDYFTLTIFFRLFIADIFSEYDKGIYIDSDIVVNGDISKLYNIDLGENIIGACKDYSIQDNSDLIYYVENAVGVKGDKYINSGVLLMNLEMMRKKSLSKKFLNLLNTYHFKSVAPDQDYLNAICNGKILYLDEKWDAMPIENRECLDNPQIIHYNLFAKPWFFDNIHYEEYFWKYAKNNVFYDDILEIKRNYSEEQKKADMDCMISLVKTAKEIADKEDVTFKKKYECGEDIRL